MVLRTCVQRPTHWPWFTWPVGRLLFLPLSLPAKYEPGLQARLLREAMRYDAETELDPGGPGPQCRVTSKDVLCVQLYEDCLIHPRPRGMDPLPDYDETWSLLREFGPRFRGILVGNQLGTEVSYRHCYGTWRGDAHGNVGAIAEFVLEVGGNLRGIGVAPWFAPMDWDVAQDAYKGGGRIREGLNEVGATAFVACGYTLVPGTFVKPGPIALGYPDQLRAQCQWSGRGWRLPEPGEDLPILRDYLREGDFYAGLGGADGVRAGNMQLLSDYGFNGFSTKLEEDERGGLEEEFGEWWSDDWSLPLLRLRVSGAYTYRGRTYYQGQAFMPRNRKERTYLLSIGGSVPIFEEVT